MTLLVPENLATELLWVRRRRRDGVVARPGLWAAPSVGGMPLDGVLAGPHQSGHPVLGWALEKVGESVSVWDPGLEQAAERMGEGGELACGAGLLPWALRSSMLGL